VWGGGSAYRLVVGGNLRDKDYLEDLNIDGRIIFKKYIFYK
jgi:hypothetical protein